MTQAVKTLPARLDRSTKTVSVGKVMLFLGFIALTFDLLHTYRRANNCICYTGVFPAQLAVHDPPGGVSIPSDAAGGRPHLQHHSSRHFQTGTASVES